MPSYLLDTTVLIDHLRGRDTGLLPKLQQAHISAMTRFEIMRGARHSELQATRVLLDTLISLDLTTQIMDVAADYARLYERSHRLEAPDLFIAATAKTHRVTLVTSNRKHYPMTDITVVQPADVSVLPQKD